MPEAGAAVSVETLDNLEPASAPGWDDIEAIEPGTPSEPRAPEPEPAAGAAATATAPVEPVATGGVKTDSMGRLHRADGTMMSREEAEAHRAANPQAAEATAPVASPTAEAVAPAAAPAVPDLPTPTPWTFRAKGQDVTPPGAQHIPGHGVFIPEADVPNFRAAWAHHMERDELLTRSRTLDGELQTARAAAKAVEAKLDVLYKGLSVPALVQRGMSAEKADDLISRLALDIGRAEVSIALTARTQAPATVAKSSDRDVMEQVDSLIEEARQSPQLQDLFRHPKAGPAFEQTIREDLLQPQFRVKWGDIPASDRERMDPRLQSAEFFHLQAGRGRIGSLAQRFRAMLPPPQTSAPSSSQVQASNAATLTRAAGAGGAAAPPAAASAPSASPAAAPRASRRPPSHFPGQTDKERAKAARDWFNDPDAI